MAVRGEAETETIALWLVVLELLARGWWLSEVQKSFSGLAANKYFVYLALRTSALGMGKTVRLIKETHCLGQVE